MSTYLEFGSARRALKMAMSPAVRFHNFLGGQFIDIIITEVIAFALYGVLVSAIATANLTGSLKGTNGILVGLVTLFYILAAALLPVQVVRHAGGGKVLGR